MPDPQSVVVDIPGIGRKAFPATMSQQQIQENVRALMTAAREPELDTSLPRSPNPVSREKFASMSDTERNVMFHQSQEASKALMQRNPQGPYGGELANIAGFKLHPEEVIGGVSSVVPNLASRASAGRATLEESGNLFKGLAAALKSPDSNGLMSRLMQAVSGKAATGAPAAEVLAVQAPGVGGQTATKWGWLDRSPLPEQARRMVRNPKNLRSDRTDDLLGTLQRLLGGVKVEKP